MKYQTKFIGIERLIINYKFSLSTLLVLDLIAADLRFNLLLRLHRGSENTPNLAEDLIASTQNPFARKLNCN